MDVTDGLQLFLGDIGPITLLDLFAGIGGFSCGLESTGEFQTVAFCEKDPFCQRVLKHHFKGIPIYDDITKLYRSIFPPRARCWSFGSPCQDLSVAGEGAGLEAGERSSLFFEVIRCLCAARDRGESPDYIIFENVFGLLSSSDRRDFGTVLRSLADTGCFDRLEWCVLQASDFGLPHKRSRVFLVGYREKGLPDSAVLRDGQRLLETHDGVRESAPRGGGAEDGSLAHSGGLLGEFTSRQWSESSHADRAGSSSESSGSSIGVADTGRKPIELQQRTQRIPEHQGSGNAVADSTGARPVRSTDAGVDSGPKSEGIWGLESERIGAELAHAGRGSDGAHKQIGQPERSHQADPWSCSETVADSSPRGRGELRKPSECERLADGGDKDGGNADRRRREQCDATVGLTAESGARHEPVADAGDGLIQKPRRGSEGRDGAGSAGAAGTLADTKGIGSQGQRSRGQRSRGQQVARAHVEEELSVRDGRGGILSGIPIAPPGPADREAWARIIERWPFLAPAITEEEAERLLLRVADEFSNLLDFDPDTQEKAKTLDQERTSRLRACGNAVAPICAQYVGRSILAYDRRG